MAFFKDMKEKLTESVQDVTKKTTELLEISKLNTAISTEKDAISAAKLQIGDKMFAMFKAGETIPEGITSDVQNIITRLETITGLETKISDLKAASEAGKVEQAAASAPSGEKPATGRFCSGCGAPLAEGVMFCGSCGKKVE